MPIFRNDQHRQRYALALQRMPSADEYHKPLAYLIALDDICSAHAAEIYDDAADSIKPEVLRASWMTGTTGKTVRLAFNLWNGFCYADADADEPCSDYTPESIFCTDYLPFFLEAIRLRYAIYAETCDGCGDLLDDQSDD